MIKASQTLGASINGFIDSKANVEAIKTGKGEILFVNKKPLLFKIGEKVYPTLFSQEMLLKLPRVVVDMGAVRHICNGADIMAPGIVQFKGNFCKESIVLVVDEKYGKSLALGEAQYDAESAQILEKGVVIKSVHFVGDEIWNAIKALEK